MSNQNKTLRNVNRILGEKPRLGPFPAEMIFPWSAIAIINVLIFNYTFKAGWLATFLSTAWGWATWWVVSENKDFFGKFVGVPRITRGYRPFGFVKSHSFKSQKSEVRSQK